MAFELNTFKDVRDWLSKPENQHETQLFVIKWKGSVPTIDKKRAHLIQSDGLCEVVIREHQKRRGGRIEEFDPTGDE